MSERTTHEKRVAYVRAQLKRAEQALEIAQQRVRDLQARAAELAETPDAQEAA